MEYIFKDGNMLANPLGEFPNSKFSSKLAIFYADNFIYRRKWFDKNLIPLKY